MNSAGTQSRFKPPKYGGMAPHDVQAEVMALGAALGFPEARAKLSTLQPGDFFREEHGWIWAAIQRVPEVTVDAVCAEVGDDIGRFSAHGLPPEMAASGGRIYIEELVEQVFTHYGCEVYARDVINCARLRRLIQAAGRVAQIAYEGHSAASVVEYASDLFGGLRVETDTHPFLNRKGEMPW